ncbi:MAG: beta strand repeat-containing protein, partial [Rhodanobacteraceae bacterium]
MKEVRLPLSASPRWRRAFACVSIAAAVTLPPLAWAGSPPRFAPTAMHFDDCCFMTSIAAADLTGDGHADLVTGNGLSYDVSVLLGDGAGGFAAPVSIPLTNPQFGYVVIALGDTDGDGNADLAATGFDETTILYFTGDGAGGFTGPATYDIGAAQFPRAIVLADVTGDGKLDIVTANAESNNVSVLAGDGAGVFADALNFDSGVAPNGLAVGDVTGDGNIDLVTANSVSLDVSVLAGDGDGGFAAPVSYSIGADAIPFSVAVGDVTGDGNADIVTANAGTDGSEFPPPELPGSVSIFVSDGSGSFAAALQRSAGAGDGRAHGVAIGDITGDGANDIVVTRPIANTAAILASDGAGGFADAVTRRTSVGPTPVAIADVTGDGALDVVAANAVSASISVLPGDGAGEVGFAGNHDAGTTAFWVASGDLDDDGAADVVTANLTSNDVSVLLGDGSGGFAPEVRYAVGDSPTSIAIGYVDDDAYLDLVVANLGSGDVSVLLGDGSGAFGAAQNFSIGEGFQSPYALALGDADEDGHLDIATANTNVSNDSLSLLLGDGTGGFADAVMLPLGDPGYYSPQGVAFADVTGDGHADIVSANFGSSNLSLLAGDGGGNFAAPVHLDTDAGPVVVVGADVTGDGNPDLVTVNQTAQSVSVLAGDGSGGFAVSQNFAIYPAQTNYEYDAWPWGLAIGDVTGDGLLDLVTANTQNDTISVLPNDGAGGFGAYFNFDTGAHPGAVAIADIDGDGAADVIS